MLVRRLYKKLEFTYVGMKIVYALCNCACGLTIYTNVAIVHVGMTVLHEIGNCACGYEDLYEIGNCACGNEDCTRNW